MSTRDLASLNALKTFESVARHLSFTRGAEELGVTQSAASHQIRKLEEELGISLFDRKGGNLSLTEAGEQLRRSVQEGLTVIARGLDMLRAQRVQRPFGLHVRPHFALKWLAPRLVRLWQTHPGLDLRLQHSNLPADFSDRSIDLAIEWCHHENLKPEATLLLEGDLTPACSPRLLAAGQTRLKPKDLSAFPLLHEADEESWQAWLAGAGVSDLSATRNHYYDDTNVRQEAALRGEGFALVCPALVAEEVAAGTLVCPFDFRLQSYSYYVVTPQHAVESSAQRRVKGWLLAEAGRGAS